MLQMIYTHTAQTFTSVSDQTNIFGWIFFYRKTREIISKFEKAFIKRWKLSKVSKLFLTEMGIFQTFIHKNQKK